MHETPHGLMFHHFSSPTDPCSVQGAINSEEFYLILEYYSKEYNLLGAHEFYERAMADRLEKKDVTLTFDDCLKSQFKVAHPILKHMNIDSYFFAYNGAFNEIPDDLEFYRDFRNNYFDCMEDFYDLFMKEFSRRHPKDFSEYLKSFPSDYLSHCNFYSENDRKFRFARDKILFEEKYFLIMESMMKSRNYNKQERKKIIFLSTEDLVEISKNGNIIGLHSSTHPTSIDNFEYSQQLKEYQDNFEFIHGVTGCDPTSMSHPNGKYNADTLQILSALGIKIGFRSNMKQKNFNNLLEIPREDHTNVLSVIKEKS